MRGSKAKKIRKFLRTMPDVQGKGYKKMYKRLKKTPKVEKLINQEYEWRKLGKKT